MRNNLSRSERGFAPVIVTIIVVIGIALATYLTLHTQVFRPHASNNMTRAEFIDANGNIITQTSSRNVTLKITYVADQIPVNSGGLSDNCGQTVVTPGSSSTSQSSSVVTSGDSSVNVLFKGPSASAGGGTATSSCSHRSFIQTTTTVTSNGQSTTTTTTSGSPIASGSLPASQFPSAFRISNSLPGLSTAVSTNFNQNGQQVNWLLDSGDGVKTVFVQFQVGGVWQALITSNITLITSQAAISTATSSSGRASFILQEGVPISTVLGVSTIAQVTGGVNTNGTSSGGRIVLPNGQVLQGGNAGPGGATNGTITQSSSAPTTQPTTSTTTNSGITGTNNGGQQGSVTTPNVIEIPVRLMVQSDLDAANLFSAKLLFDASKFQVVKVDTSGSFVTNWVTNTFDNSAGVISAVGGVPNPGFKTSGSPVLMATIYLTSTNIGAVTLSIDSISAIYRNSDNVDILHSTSNPTNNGNSGGGVTTPVATSLPTFPPSPLPSASSQPVVNPSCLPRPACLDSTPRCLPPEPMGGWCPSNSPNPSSTTVTFTGGNSNSPGNSSSSSSSSTCTIHSTNFSTNSAPAGSVVTVTATGDSNCNGQTVRFGVSQDNGLLGSNQVSNPPPATTFNGNTATSTWVTQSNNGALGGLLGSSSGYSLNASLPTSSSGGQSVTASNELKVDKSLSQGFKKGDVNHDGSITLDDLSAFLTNYNNRSGLPEMDMNSDGVINSIDFSALISLLKQQGVIQ